MMSLTPMPREQRKGLPQIRPIMASYMPSMADSSGTCEDPAPAAGTLAEYSAQHDDLLQVLMGCTLRGLELQVYL
jgi:hypothetical protein